MKLVTYSKNGTEQLAFYIKDMLYDVHTANNMLPDNMADLLKYWERTIDDMRQTEADIKSGKNIQ